MNFLTWLRLARHPATVRRAQLTALVVGTILGVINHGPALVAGQVNSGRIFQILLTFLVPYTVSTISSVATRQELRDRSETARSSSTNERCTPADLITDP